MQFITSGPSRKLETETFIQSLKRFIARRGRPAVIYSDNGSTFVKAAKWLKQVRKDEQVQGLLQQYDITWKFNLSRAPWWGGQFERLIGIVKSAMYKVIGGATLSWSELSEVLLDIEIQINRQPLSYMEDDIELYPPWRQQLYYSNVLVSYQKTNHGEWKARTCVSMPSTW